MDSWHEVLSLLRRILDQTILEKTNKWGGEVYTLNGKNIIGIAPFKSYISVWFYQGVYLSDPNKVLVNAQHGKTKALRQWRFYSLQDIDEKALIRYIDEAIQNERDGKVWKPVKKGRTPLPEELLAWLVNDKDTQMAFNNLPAYKQTEYAEYIESAKKEETRNNRIQKIIPLIKEGKGLNDKYRNSSKGC